MTRNGFFATLATAIAVALLPACDIINLPQIRPGETTVAEVLERMGEPAYRHGNEDGTVTWEYNRQPAGVHCYMISFDDRQIVSRLEQVLSPAYFSRVRPGMSRNEIRRLLGAPGSRMTFDNLQEEIWEWRIEGALPTEETYFMVHFDTTLGAVRKSSQRVQPKG